MLGGVPSGHIYAHVMHVVDLATYEIIITKLESAKLVQRRRNHLLVWIGPKLES